MKIDEKLVREAFAAGRKYIELHEKVLSAVGEKLPHFDYVWLDDITEIVASEHEQEKYGEDAMFVISGVDRERRAHVDVVVRRDGSIQLFYEDERHENREATA